MKHLFKGCWMITWSIVMIDLFLPHLIQAQTTGDELRLNDREYFEKRGLNVLVFSNWYDGYFGDSKITGIELIHHGVRTATNGDVRLNPTPGQWNPIPKSYKRTVDKDRNRIDVQLSYPDHHFDYQIRTEARDGGIIISVHLEKPVPTELEGRAGFNLEFLPSAYFGKAFMMDDRSGTFPLYPSGPMIKIDSGSVEPLPLAQGKVFVLAPEDPLRHVTIWSGDEEMMLYDGRNQAQNGWFVIRSLLPKGKTGKVLEWFLSANTIPGWTRPPMIAHSQVGYHPNQKKTAIIELDKNDAPLTSARLMKIQNDGKLVQAYQGEPKVWGDYLRYRYLTFDFSSIREDGLYAIEYGNERTDPFRIARDVYRDAWHPTLDVYLPVQMDHMLVNEAYRVWHGAAHLDDALQAPVNHEHFDLYAQGPTTDTPFKPGEHIPGLNIGGWFDAGDYDIRTQTQYAAVLTLVQAWEAFGIDRDETTVDQKRRYVDIHVPDGKPDILQQIEHGALALIAQFRAVGHAINGIIESDLSQYTHLGDAVTKTDNRIFDPKLSPDETDGFKSGIQDDRWAFTTKSSALNYGSIAALAAASRALRGFNDPLAEECLTTAKRIWDEEQSHQPDVFRHGNTTGGSLENERFQAAVELCAATKDPKYRDAINQLWPDMEKWFLFNAMTALRARPFLNDLNTARLEMQVREYQKGAAEMEKQNPFGVPISPGTWAGSGWVAGWALTNYAMHKAYPEIVDAESVFRGLNYLYGCHPGSNLSLVSGVGTQSKTVAYGNNRADFSFIAGGLVPGVLIVKPDFSENKEDWPFLWGENEYVVNLGPSYIYLVNAADELLNQINGNH